MKKLMALTAVVVALGVTPAMANDKDMDHKDYTTLKSSPKASKASYDLQFLDTMIAHHRQGVQMAEVAQEKSQNVEVRNHAETMEDELQSEINKLESVRSDVHEKAPEAVNLSLDGMSSEDVKGLNETSAKKLDEKYLKMSIRHEEGGLEMSREASKKAKNAKVKEIARELSGKHTGRITELKELQKNLDD